MANAVKELVVMTSLDTRQLDADPVVLRDAVGLQDGGMRGSGAARGGGAREEVQAEELAGVEHAGRGVPQPGSGRGAGARA